MASILLKLTLLGTASPGLYMSGREVSEHLLGTPQGGWRPLPQLCEPAQLPGQKTAGRALAITALGSTLWLDREERGPAFRTTTHFMCRLPYKVTLFLLSGKKNLED